MLEGSSNNNVDKSPLTEEIFEKNKIQKTIDILDSSFKDLVRQKIDLDAPRRKVQQELIDTKKLLDELPFSTPTISPQELNTKKKLLERIKIFFNRFFAAAQDSRMISDIEGFEKQQQSLLEKIKLLEADLSNFETSDIITDINLTPIDEKILLLKAEKLKKEQNIKNMMDSLRN